MPTLKQKAVVKDLLENRGKPIGVSMAENGYELNTAKNPKNLTDSKGWKELMNEYLPDKTLLEVHQQGLTAKRVILSPTEPDREVDDHPTRHKFLETAYRLKRYLGADVLQQFNVGGEMTLEFSK